MHPETTSCHQRAASETQVDTAVMPPEPGRLRRVFVFAASMVLISATGGCAVVAVADAAVTVVATTVKVGAKVVGAGVDAILPDDESEDDD